MRSWCQFLCVAALAILSISSARADFVAAWLSEKGGKEIPMSSAKISTGAQFENNVILYVQPESQAMWTAPEDMDGYLYMMVRSGSEAMGMDSIVPQILYEVKIDNKIIEMKPLNNPSVLRVMVGKAGVFTGWIRSFEPVKIAKGAPIIVTSWIDWGVVCVLTVTPLEAPEPLPRIEKSAPRAADQVFAGQSTEEEKALVDVQADQLMEQFQPYYLAPKDIEENKEVKLNKNQLDYAKADAEAQWIVQRPAEGYVYLKVTSGPAEGDDKFIKPEIQYSVTIDGHTVPMKRIKPSNLAPESRYKVDQPSGWIRSEQVVSLTPGSTIGIKAKQTRTSVYQIAVSKTRIVVE